MNMCVTLLVPIKDNFQIKHLHDNFLPTFFLGREGKNIVMLERSKSVSSVLSGG